MKDNLIASPEHEKEFRKTWKIKSEFENNPEVKAAFEYAATHKLTIPEMNYVGGVIEEKNYDT